MPNMSPGRKKILSLASGIDLIPPKYFVRKKDKKPERIPVQRADNKGHDLSIPNLNSRRVSASSRFPTPRGVWRRGTLENRLPTTETP